MARNVSSTAFPPGTKVYLHPFGAQRPGEGTDSEESKTVGKDGLVAFESDLRSGQFVWLAGEVGDEWQTVQVPVKDGKHTDVKNPGEALSKVAAPSTHPSNEPIHGARSTQNTRGSASKGDANDKLEYVSNMTGAEALRVSAAGSFVTIPDGSHADPAAHQPVVPAHTDGLTAEQREAKAEARRQHKKQEGAAAARPKKSAQQESEKHADGQPTKAESTHDEPTETPDELPRTAL